MSKIERKVDMLISGMKIPKRKTRSRVVTIATSLLIAIVIIASASLINVYYVQTGTIADVKSAITITAPDGTSYETPWTTEPVVTLGTIQAGGTTYIYPETAPLQDDGEGIDWSGLSYIDATDDGSAWDDSSDTIFIDDGTNDGVFDDGETVLAGVTPIVGTSETGVGVKGLGWNLIKTYDAADTDVWDDSVDAIVLDRNDNNIYDGDDEYLAGSGYYTITNHANTDADVFIHIEVTEILFGTTASIPCNAGLLVGVWDLINNRLLLDGDQFVFDNGCQSADFQIYVTADPLIDASSTYGYIITMDLEK